MHHLGLQAGVDGSTALGAMIADGIVCQAVVPEDKSGPIVRIYYRLSDPQGRGVERAVLNENRFARAKTHRVLPRTGLLVLPNVEAVTTAVAGDLAMVNQPVRPFPAYIRVEVGNPGRGNAPRMVELEIGQPETVQPAALDQDQAVGRRPLIEDQILHRNGLGAGTTQHQAESSPVGAGDRGPFGRRSSLKGEQMGNVDIQALTPRIIAARRAHGDDPTILVLRGDVIHRPPACRHSCRRW